MINQNNQIPTRSDKKISWVNLSTTVVFILVVCFIFFWGMVPQRRVSKLVGKVAPQLRFQNQSGEWLDLSHYSEKFILINFWASWCRPCMDEMPALKRLEEKIEKDFQILAINVDSPPTSSEFINKNFLAKLPNQLFLKSNSNDIDAYQVSQIPVSYFLDQKGVIKKVYIGPRVWDSARMVREIASMMR